MSDAPADEAGVVTAIRDATQAGEPLLIQGRGSKLGMLRPVQAARSLSTRNLTGITLYAPKELIISARAGTTVAELEATLRESGQHLIAEPPDLSALLGAEAGAEQTIGGAVATNLSGPRRVAWGAMRDHIMGVRAVNGAGETIRSGGRVLKNVTGLDLCKLLAGSHGTLAVLTEITLKVLPAPEQTGSLFFCVQGAEEGVRLLSAGLCSPFGVSGAAYLPPEAADRIPWLSGQGAIAILRIEDFARSVDYRLGQLMLQLGGERLDDETSRAAWRAIRDVVPLRTEAGEAIWRVSVRPSRGPAALEAITHGGGRGFLDWGGGLLWAAGPPELHDLVRQVATEGKGTWTVVRGPDGMRAAVDVLPPEPAPLQRITRRVKAAMDPHGMLNPGRMYAGL